MRFLPAPQNPFCGVPSIKTNRAGKARPVQGFSASRKNAWRRFRGGSLPLAEGKNHSSSLSTAKNASVGTFTDPRLRMRFLPSFCFSSSFFFRVTSPP